MNARDAWVRALQRTAAIEAGKVEILPRLIDDWALRFDAAPALLARDAALTYRELAVRCRRYARWGLSQNLQAGDVVTLFLPNCADYLPAWLGLTRLGVVVALINSQLVGEPLAHSLRLVAPKAIIVGASLAASFAAVRGQLPAAVAWGHGTSPGRNPDHGEGHGARRDHVNGASLFEPLEAALQRSCEPLSALERALPEPDATALYIYTSGTTGLPKAARVSHYRLLQWTHWFAGLMDTGPDDRMYNCLPLYHSVGGVVACGATLLGGGAVVIRERFSASNFWRDVTDERCTLFQYIGELCRYLLNTVPQALETQHALRLACGNGLRPEIWNEFKHRFKIPRLLEYYAATEGNFSLYNCEEEPGAIGRIPPFLSQRLPVALVRIDHDREQPLRGADGRCERCAADEVGEAIGLIPTGRGPASGRFEGYTDDSASARKRLRDVFTIGDEWYRTGDLMRRDARGFYYFVDRLGDTYRWKGENVATTEVLTVLLSIAGVREGVVYGVSVPGVDGRAGMAALVVDAAFDLAAFRAAVVARLPVFARPVFLRVVESLDATGTFKPKKQELLKAGFDPQRTTDPLYVDQGGEGRYVELDAARHADLLAGRVRL